MKSIVIILYLSSSILYAQSSCDMPVITTQPVSANNCSGSSASLSVSVAGQGSFSFLWKKGNATANSTGPTLVFPVLSMADAGTYTVTVSNACGSIQSASAVVNVTSNEFPVVHLILGKMMMCESEGPTQIFANGSGGGSAPIYKLYDKGISVTGFQTSSSFSYPFTPGQHNLSVEMLSNATCIAPGAANLVRSSDEMLTIDPLPTLSNAGQDYTTCGNSYQLQANQVLSGSGTWSVISGKGDINDQKNPNSLITNLFGTTKLAWIVSSQHNICPASMSQVYITRVSDITSPSSVSSQSKTISFGAPAPLLSGVPLQPNEVGTWTSTGLATITSNGQTGNLLLGVNTFNYTIISAISGCPPAVASVDITVANPLSIASALNTSEHAVFPNPFTKEIYINNLKEAYDLRITDAKGSIKLVQTVNTSENTISTREFEPGIYFLQLRNKKETTYFKMLKQ
ncbi:MAG: T9SS type A sorting domain-containing protein [Opitutaceae bacterium]|nr:T9SS type A sorting domain-containing protein [Cytophagales bacterium]